MRRQSSRALDFIIYVAARRMVLSREAFIVGPLYTELQFD